MVDSENGGLNVEAETIRYDGGTLGCSLLPKKKAGKDRVAILKIGADVKLTTIDKIKEEARFFRQSVKGDSVSFFKGVM